MVDRLTTEGEQLRASGLGPAAEAGAGAEGAPERGGEWDADYLGEEWRAGGGSVDGGD